MIKREDLPLKYLHGIHLMTWVFSQHLRYPSSSLTWALDPSWPGPASSGLLHLPQHHSSDSQDCSGRRNSDGRPIYPAYLWDSRAASLKYLFLNSELRILTRDRIHPIPCWYESDIRFCPEPIMGFCPSPAWIWCWDPILPPWFPILFIPCSLQLLIQ